jgi:hypothetical protein
MKLCGPLVVALVLFAAPAGAQEPAPSTPARGEDGHETETLDPLRERFRAGMDKYKTGAFAEAVVIWSAIYTELGTEKGYRLAFNLARAYDHLGESSTQAAEYYEAYLKETARRRAAGETLEPIVEKQELEAKDRLEELVATKGRIDVRAQNRSVAVRIDGGAPRLAGFIAFVVPERVHVVTFNPGEKNEKKVEVNVPRGEIVTVEAPLEPVAGPPPVRYETVRQRPFREVVLYIAGAVTVASVIVPVVLYANANAFRDDYNGLNDTPHTVDRVARAQQAASDYDTAKTVANASLALPIVLAAVTAGLTTYWIVGSKAKRVAVPVPAGVEAGLLPLPGGGFASATARF